MSQIVYARQVFFFTLRHADKKLTVRQYLTTWPIQEIIHNISAGNYMESQC